MEVEKAIQLIKESFESLSRSGLLEQDVDVKADTVLLGSGSVLDSMGFVTFVTDLEDRLTRETGEDIFLVLNEIHEFSVDSAYLSVNILACYCAKLTGE
jgi:hypothetical protein